MPRPALRLVSVCLLTSILFLMLATGLGLPTGYRLVLGGIDILEHQGEVVVLADIRLTLRKFGFPRCGALYPVAVLKIVVKPDGTVQTDRCNSHVFIVFPRVDTPSHA